MSKKKITVSFRLDRRLLANIIYFVRVKEGKLGYSRSRCIQEIVGAWERANFESLPDLSEEQIEELIRTEAGEVSSYKTGEAQVPAMDELKRAYLQAEIEGESE